MDKENPWGKDGTGKDVDLHLYRSMIGSLRYLTASKPNIMFVVCACARHQVTPKECHLHAVKRIFRYLKTIVATSTTEAEYVAAASGCRQVLWIQNHLLDYGFMPCEALSKEISSSILLFLRPIPLNTNFHPIVDFIQASHLRYALTINPTVYVSHIRQFWSTARIETTKEGTKILATVDGKLGIVSESSIRRNLKLNDEAGISSLPDAELFKNLTLMGYNILPNQKFTFQKGQFSHQWKYLIHIIMQCLSPKSNGFNEFSSNIATALAIHQRARIAQSLVLPPVADEPASPFRDDSQGEACPTDSGLESDQDRETITKTSTLPSDSTPRVTSFVADEGSMQHKLTKITDLYTRLQRVKLLEDIEGGGITQSGEDAPIKGRSLDEGEAAAEEKSTKRASDDTEEMVTVLTSLNAASILTSGVSVSISPVTEVSITEVPTGSGSISTASLPGTGVPTSSGMVPTASLIFTTATESTPYTRRKGKEKMVESDTPKKKKLQEQIDVQVARELEEEMARDA
nr:hypothetical protein [Tanacetum cinerariifolium]